MSDRRARSSWWDDLAAMCAAPLRDRPRLWTVAMLVLALLIGRHGGWMSTASQVAAGGVLGGLLARAFAIRVDVRPLWIVPVVTAAAHVMKTPSHWDFGEPLAVATGALVAMVGVMSPRRMSVWAGAMLVWGGVVAARALELVVLLDLASGTLSLPTTHVLAIGRPLAVAGAALMLRGPSPEQRAHEGPRRPRTVAGSWIVWGLAPALALAIPVPPAALTGWPQLGSGQLRLEALVALSVVVLAVRVGDHVARQMVVQESARTRTRARLTAAPWCASVVIVAMAWGLDKLGGQLVMGLLEAPGSYLQPAVVYAAPDVWSAYPSILIAGLAALAHGPLRASRGVARVAPFVAVLFGLTWITLVQIWPPILFGTIQLRDVGAWLMSAGVVVALVPPGVARIVPLRARGITPVDFVLLLVLVSASLVRRTYWSEWAGGWGHYAIGAIIASLLFHRLATCRIRTCTLVLAAIAAGVASASLLIGVDVDWLHPFDPRPGRLALPTLDNPNQLKVVPPIVVGWLLALVPLLFARAMNTMQESGASVDGRFPDPTVDATLMSGDGRDG